MGLVNIPEVAPGKLHLELHLDSEEAYVTLARLKLALEELKARQSTDVTLISPIVVNPYPLASASVASHSAQEELSANFQHSVLVSTPSSARSNSVQASAVPAALQASSMVSAPAMRVAADNVAAHHYVTPAAPAIVNASSGSAQSLPQAPPPAPQPTRPALPPHTEQLPPQPTQQPPSSAPPPIAASKPTMLQPAPAAPVPASKSAKNQPQQSARPKKAVPKTTATPAPAPTPRAPATVVRPQPQQPQPTASRPVAVSPPPSRWVPPPALAAMHVTPAPSFTEPFYAAAPSVEESQAAEVPSFEGWTPEVAQPAAARPAAGQQTTQSNGATDSNGVWTCSWVSDRSDHNNDPVEGMAFVDNLQGMVPMESTAAGWLVSCSRQQLVLWNTLDGSGGLPQLLAVHSQVTDYRSVALDIEPETTTLMAASSEGSGRECVSLHSLDPARLFSPTYQLRLPTTPVPTVRSQLHRQVVSLHRFRGALSETCAASYDGQIVVFPTSQKNPQVPIKAMAEWKAHDGLIKVLTTAKPLQLWSADASGSIKMWSMKAKPITPALTMRHGKSIVSGLQIPNEIDVVSTAHDGQLYLWDVRKTNEPKKKVRVDGKPILCMAVSPVCCDIAAAITHGGVFGVDLMDSAATVTQISDGSGSHACRLAWATPSTLLVGRRDGSIAVYRRAM